MRANSPTTARPVATAAMALVAAVLVPLAIPSTALADRWLRPVPGEVARSFQYARATPFTAGAHRGVDLVASPGTAARAACGGRVSHAGPVARHGGVVSVRCGFRRVSYMPLARMTVHAGDAVRRGAPIGTVGAGHGGLHLGVRREGDPFGYVDPALLLEPPAAPSAPVVPATRRPRAAFPRRVAPRESIPRVAAPRRTIARMGPATDAPPHATPRGDAPPRAAPAVNAPPPAVPAVNAPPRVAPAVNAPPHAAPPADAQPAASHRPARPDSLPSRRASLGPASEAARRSSPPPWPVWAGLGLLLAGATGSGTIKVRRRRLDRRRLGEAHATT